MEEHKTCPVQQALITGEKVRVSPLEHNGRYYEVVAAPFRDKTGERQLVVLYVDISDRLRMEMSLRESEERYRDLFENASDLIQSLDPDGRVMHVNRAWLETLGYREEEVERMRFSDIVHPDWRERQERCLEDLFRPGGQHHVEMVLLARDGREVMIEGVVGCRMKDGRPVATRCIFRDVTEQRRLQQELLRSQKLEAIGVLAGGIAHDFNNLLTAFTGNLSLARLKIPADNMIEPYLEAMEKASERAQALTKQLLTFAKGGSPVKTAVTPDQLVEQIAGFILRGSNCRLEMKMEEHPWPVDADDGQIGQVVQNLVLNAAQAMPDGGVITVRLTNLVLDANERPSLPPGKYVLIEVQDKGCGIAPEHLPRIFDPYFSTKKGGSGLGLAVSYAIVKKHQGLLTVDSSLGAGTTFSLYLPASHYEEKPTQDDSVPSANGHGRILLLDDEDLIRTLAFEMLTSLGYEVETARTGEEAIRLFQEARGAGTPFDLCILDLTIPGGMGGLETMIQIRRIDTEVRAIVSSGYSNESVMAEYMSHGFAAVLPKPYKLKTLNEVLHKALG